MGKYETLRKQGLASARGRGHKMTLQGYGQWTCKDCGRSLVVTVSPLPNEANVMGAAVAVHCSNKLSLGEFFGLIN